MVTGPHPVPALERTPLSVQYVYWGCFNVCLTIIMSICLQYASGRREERLAAAIARSRDQRHDNYMKGREEFLASSITSALRDGGGVGGGMDRERGGVGGTFSRMQVG